MGLVSKTYTFSAGAVIVAAQHNTNFNTLYNLVNGSLDTDNLDANAAIVDTQLAQITTASKVNTSALTTTSQAAGDVLYNDGTNWVRLAKSAGKYLKSGASAVSWETALSSGLIVQVQNALASTSDVTAVFTKDNSAPLYSEGNAVVSKEFTPTSASNNLLIRGSVWGGASGDIDLLLWLNDATGTDEALAVRGHTTQGAGFAQLSIEYFVAAGSTDARTYYLMAAVSSGSWYLGQDTNGDALFGASSGGSITIEEIQA